MAHTAHGAPGTPTLPGIRALSGTWAGPALLAVANRLAQPEGAWRPFTPPRLLAHLYPKPASWEPRWSVD